MSQFDTIYGRELLGEVPAFAPAPYLLVTMEDLWPDLEPLVAGDLAPHFVDSLERDVIRAALDEAPPYRSVVGIGGGRAVDVAKLFAQHRSVPLFQYPTSMSVNAPFGHRAAVRVDGDIRYVGWSVPEAVFVDFDLVRSAPVELNRSGVGDIFCYHTARWDWETAHRSGRGEPAWPFDPTWAARAGEVLRSVLDALDDIRRLDDAGIRVLMDAHRWGGAAFADAGWNPRPIEGAEHFFFYALERTTGRHLLHGQAVGLGVLLISLLQDNEPERIRAACDRVGLAYHPSSMGLRRVDVDRALRAMAEYVERVGLWYTAASHLPITDEFLDRAADWLDYS